MAAKTKNIGGTDKDAFYRYKRPELKTKVEKPGTNGVKTVIENIGAIAKALKVPPEYPTRFLGYELCTQATFEDSTDRTCTIVKGKHTEKELDKALDEFIKKFVLCPTCKLPETRISVKKGQVRIKCASCGHAGPLTTGHRLENYIAKNPPNQTKESKAKGTGKDPTKKTKGKDDSSDEEPSQPTDGKEKPAEKQKEEIEKEDWSLDTSIEAQKARRAEFLAAQLVKTNRTSGAGEEGEKGESTKPETILKNFIKDNSDGVAIAAELDRLQLKHGLSPEERYRILLTAAIDLSQPKTLGAQFTKRAPLFKKAVKGKAAGVLFITSIERLLDSGSIPHGGSQEAETRGKSQEDLKTNLVSRIALVLQKLYEGDVLEEDAILTWAQSPPEVSAWAVGRDVASYARKSAKPFIDWLQSAEEDED